MVLQSVIDGLGFDMGCLDEFGLYIRVKTLRVMLWARESLLCIHSMPNTRFVFKLVTLEFEVGNKVMEKFSRAGLGVLIGPRDTRYEVG